MDILITTIGLLVVAFLLIAFSGKYFVFGLQFAMAKMKHKDNLGLMFVRSLGNNYSFPKFIDLTKISYETKDEFRTLTRDSFNGFRVFGCPTIFVDSDDATVTTGLYTKLYNLVRKNKDTQVVEAYQVTGAQVMKALQVESKIEKTDRGELIVVPSTHVISLGDDRIYDSGIPKYLEHKPTHRVTSQMNKQAVIQSAFTKVLDMFNKNTQLIMIIAGLGVLAAGAAAYFGFNNTDAIANLCGQAMTTNTDLVLTRLDNLTSMCKLG